MNIGLKILINSSFKLNRVLNTRNFSYLIIKNNDFRNYRSLLYKNNLALTPKMYYNQEKKQKNPLTLTNDPLISYFPSLSLSIISKIKMWFVMKRIDPSFKSAEFISGCEQVGFLWIIFDIFEKIFLF
jgi:hypothetical protein